MALRNLLIKAFACLHPDQKTGIRSIQKIRVVGSSLPCKKPEDLTLLTDEWRVYAETDTPTKMGTEGRWNTCQNWSIPESSSAVEDSIREPKVYVCLPKLYSVS